MANLLTINDQINEAIKDLPSYDHMLGRTAMQPFRYANSGSRALMTSIHVEHFMTLEHGEVPFVQTGIENEFGFNSSSYEDAEAQYKVIHKICKFSNLPSEHYFLIVQNMGTGEYDVFERVAYNHNTESYGYLFNNNSLDKLKPGDTIYKGDVIKCSTGFDEYYNKMNGSNLLTMYLSLGKTMEDSIIISKSAARKMGSQLIKTTSITINDNDVLLNLYGDDNVYKTFPDVGEQIRNGIFTSIRRIENDNILYSLSKSKLRDIMISDRNILMNGIVADIDIYCNNPDIFESSQYNEQLKYYYNERLRFCREVLDVVGPLAMNCKLSYQLQYLYSNCRDSITGKQFFKTKQFNNIIMDITVIEPLDMSPGDKMTDRYGGKGVISQIWPDEMMPMLDNGKRVEVIKNQSTCINRENIGQLHEQSLNFISMRFIDAFKSGLYSYQEMFEMWADYVSMVEDTEAKYVISAIDKYDERQTKPFIDSIIEDGCIILSTKPFTSDINIDTIAKIYERFPWISQYKVLMPVTDSNGNVRFIPARRKLVCGYIYNYRLKQYAEDKFSVTSLSATNLKGLNTRSRGNKVYEVKFTKTPIMFGQMESENEGHIGMQYVVMNLMLYSASVQARRLFEQLLIGDPYNINIKLDKNSKNRNAEIINVLMKTMGIQLEFTKTPKHRKRLCNKVIAKVVPPKELIDNRSPLWDIFGDDARLNMLYENAMTINKKGKGKKLCRKRLAYLVDTDKEEEDADKDRDVNESLQ